MTGRGQRFPFRVHQAALGEHVAAIWGWDGENQRRYHDRAFELDPRYQGRGIGGGCSAGCSASRRILPKVRKQGR